MKWSWFGLLTFAGLGCWAMAFEAASDLKADSQLKAAPEVSIRAVASSRPPAEVEHRAEPELPKPTPQRREVAAAKVEAVEAHEAAPAPSTEPKTPPANEPEVPVKAPVEKVPARVVARAAVPMGGDGILNLIASDSAEVLLDGMKIGPSPKRGIRLSAGSYKVRFDCYDDGELKAGAEQAVVVVAGKETHIDHDCATAH